MNRNRKLVAITAATAAAVLLGAGSCDDEAQEEEFDATKRQEQQYAAAQPAHFYDASQARENLIAAQDAMALGADTWTVQYVEGVGVVFECPSVGFPVPFGTNLTNPEKIVKYAGSHWVFAQMEPYGLYPPADVAATYANCVLPDGSIGIFYSEPLLVGFGFDVVWNDEAQRYEIPADSEADVEATQVDASIVDE